MGTSIDPHGGLALAQLGTLRLLLLGRRADMNQIKVIPSKRWENKATGATASLYGAVPWVRDTDKRNWEVVTVAGEIDFLEVRTSDDVMCQPLIV